MGDHSYCTTEKNQRDYQINLCDITKDPLYADYSNKNEKVVEVQSLDIGIVSDCDVSVRQTNAELEYEVMGKK